MGNINSPGRVVDKLVRDKMLSLNGRIESDTK